MKRRYLWLCLALLVAALALVACSGAQGPAGPAGPAGPEGPAGPAGSEAVAVAAEGLQFETCSTCHKGSGADHQASYNELYQDGVIQVTGLAYAFTAPNTHTVTFTMTKNGQPFNAAQADSIAIYFVPYTGEAFQFEPALERLDLKGKITCDAAGKCTSTKTGEDPAYATNYRSVNGLVVLYGRDETTGQLPARIYQNKYSFAALLETGAGVDYVSAANNDGCEKCHTDPYLKHGYIYGQVNNDPATDFYTCKACHTDNSEGGHFEWQLLVDNPEMAAAYLADETVLTDEMKAQYAYNTTLMNDVHMSHAMEFPYPQSMANCSTCHAGKLETVLSDANFNITTCKSCHPMTGAVKTEGEETLYDTTKLALKTILPEAIHGSMDLATVDCASCHGEGGNAKKFSEIHTGFDKAIYAAADLKYSDAIKVTIDEATLADNKLTVKFSAVADPAIEGLDVASIKPTVMVGLYGWDTKDFIVGAHERLTDDNGDGKINGDDARALEYELGTEHPRFTTVAAEGGKWEFTADLSAWADKIADGTVKRLEVAVMPALENADGLTLALDAPNRTFDLGANAFDDKAIAPIVDVEKCQSCHEALATNYHSADRGGSVVVCRMCHITKAGGSHLELQSRSIDSYIHAIHTGQAFDVGDINFADPVEKMKYDLHVEFPYPTHGTNCESCHLKGTYEVPDQAASLPGLISATSTNDTWTRNIAEWPVYVTGPATRACGGCHTAELVKEDAGGDLMIWKQHLLQGGYLTPAGEDASGTLNTVFEKIMGWFK